MSRLDDKRPDLAAQFGAMSAGGDKTGRLLDVEPLDAPTFQRVKLLKACSRCGGDHAGLSFRRFVQPPESATHFALCPLRGEPILMRITETT